MKKYRVVPVISRVHRGSEVQDHYYSVTTKREANANLINPIGKLQHVLY